MFVYSMRASTLKLIGVIGVSVIALVVLLTMIPTYEPTGGISYVFRCRNL